MKFQTLHNRSFVPGSFIGLLVVHILAIGAFFVFTWPGFFLFMAMSVITGLLGITMGYHRMLTHQSFEAPKPVQYFLAFIACLALQGGPLRWVATHRLHHKAADTPDDPHSPTRGFWWSHIVWNLYRHPKLVTNEDLQHLAPELGKDPVFRFMDRHFALFYLAFTAAVFAAGYLIEGWHLGLSLVLWGCVLRTVYVWHVTWFVNSASHIWGYRSYNTPNYSRNNWWVALLTFGEGWHNNHHADPHSARMGLRWYEIDMTYWTIKLMHWTGLVKKIIPPNARNVFAASPVMGSGRKAMLAHMDQATEDAKSYKQ